MKRSLWLVPASMTLIVACAAAAWRLSHDVGATNSPASEPVAQAVTRSVEPSVEPVVANHPTTTPTATATTSQPAEAPNSQAPGMVVAIDPETGALGQPSAEQLRELFPLGTSAAEPPGGFVVTHRPDGGVSIEVGSYLQEYSFIRLGPDGKRLHGCSPGPLDAHSLESLPSPTPRYEER